MRPPNMPTSRPNYRWVMLALLWFTYFGIGLAGGLAPLVTPISRDLDIPPSRMGLILGAWQFVFIFSSVLAGTIIDRWGEKKSILAGALIATLSAVFRFFSNGFETMLLAVALFGMGMPMISVGGQKVIARWFEGRRRATAVSVYMTGAWAGSIAVLALTNSVVMPLMNNSWRMTTLSYGAVAFLAGVLWWLLARDMKPETAAGRMSPLKALAGIVRVRNVQIMLVMGVVVFGTLHGTGTWLPRLLEAGGMSPAAAGVAASVSVFAGVPAVLFLPNLVPARLRGRTLAICFVGVAIGLWGIVGTSGPLQYAAIVLMGFGVSAFLPMAMLILMDSSEVPTEYLGSATGALFSVFQIGDSRSRG